MGEVKVQIKKQYKITRQLGPYRVVLNQTFMQTSVVNLDHTIDKKWIPHSVSVYIEYDRHYKSSLPEEWSSIKITGGLSGLQQLHQVIQYVLKQQQEIEDSLSNKEETE
ncbi:MAG: hypothetical protein GF334_00645 [Candidatus Altiarchaeales archaeon]|nr:hypothetical protein [Candidatus Altiarchaeales archaeon]